VLTSRMPVRRQRSALLVYMALALVLGAAVSSGARASRGPQAASQAHAPARPTGAIAALASPVTTPSTHVLYSNGPSGRYIMDGPWLFRFDRGLGARAHFERQRSTLGWSTVTVPNAWNGTDGSLRGFAGTVAWYRKDFRLPPGPASAVWIARFESVNYNARVWINGHRVGGHTGEFLPFELALPRGALSRGGVNHLVVRVDSRHNEASLPPYRLSSKGQPAAGWWNDGGLQREVYLRRVDRVDFSNVRVHPVLPCPGCAAHVDYSVSMTNYSARRQTVHVSSTFGTQPVSLGTHGIAPGRSATFTARLAVASPRPWGPGHPYLYDVNLSATASSGGAATAAAHYFLQSGIRSITVVGGHMYLNGQVLHLRGVGLQEDSPSAGMAVSAAQRAAYITDVKNLGGDFLRTQYPLSGDEQELADRAGILVWSQIPVFEVTTPVVDHSSFRRLADGYLTDDINAFGNHPSIALWSIANELSTRPSGGVEAYFRGAVAVVHRLDPGRPVGVSINGYPSVSCQPGYGVLSVIGIDDYFGWYPGPSGQVADPSLLPAYLDQMRACYPHQALFVTEFGAEANRDGPAVERGTYQFQSAFVQYQLGVFNAKPYLSGASYWALQDFRVRPGWTGGNPRPEPPVFHKGLLDFNGVPKPAYATAQSMFRGFQQVG
jgi:beta-glucuronidase